MHPLEPKRSIIHRFVHPDEGLVVLAEAGVHDRDIERVPIYSPRAIEHSSQYPPRLVRTSRSAEHVAEERLSTWPQCQSAMLVSVLAEEGVVLPAGEYERPERPKTIAIR